MSTLEYSKLILEKVSFDVNLFAKEFRKAMFSLIESEAKELASWCINKYGYDYYEVCTA